MRNLLKAVVKESSIGFLALIVLCALIWFGGEYLQIHRNIRFLAIIIALVATARLFRPFATRAVAGRVSTDNPANAAGLSVTVDVRAIKVLVAVIVELVIAVDFG